MNTHADKTTESKSSSVGNGLSLNQSGSPQKIQLLNNRPEALTQRKIQETINDSEQVNQLRTIHSLANNKNTKQLKTAQVSTTTPVVQRTPKSWETNDVIVRTLALERSGYSAGSSTWEKIKSAINVYISLSRYDVLYNLEDRVNEIFEARTTTLNKIKTNITKWTTDHPVSILNGANVKNIRAIIPELENAVKNEEEDIIVEKYGNKFLNESPVVHVPAELSTGVDTEVGDAAKALKLLQNFNNNFRFRYMGFGLPADVGLAAHQGDCGTLANIYIDVAKALHIANPTLGTRAGKQLVAAQPIKGRTTTGNTHNQGAWYFQQHFWAVVAGVNYDVLFMQSPGPAAIMENGHAEYKGVTYYTFTDNRCVIEPNQNAKFENAGTIKGEGHVFADAFAAKVFIDLNVPG